LSDIDFLSSLNSDGKLSILIFHRIWGGGNDPGSGPEVMDSRIDKPNKDGWTGRKNITVPSLGGAMMKEAGATPDPGEFTQSDLTTISLE
jgi:hypothetical protein